MNLVVKIAIMTFVLALLVGCAGTNSLQDTSNKKGDIAGFFSGLWHGVTAIITIFASLVDKNISIYEVHNSGFGYNLGFMIGIGAFASRATSKIRK